MEAGVPIQPGRWRDDCDCRRLRGSLGDAMEERIRPSKGGANGPSHCSSRQPLPPPHSFHHRRRRRLPTLARLHSLLATFTLLLLLNLTAPTRAALFYPPPPPPNRAAQYDCLENVPDGALRWVPLAINASFDRSTPAYTLNVTVYGNVTGAQAPRPLLQPASNTTYWNDPNQTFGKIPDQDHSTGLQTTLFDKISVLNYVPYKSESLRFCNYTLGEGCPIAPVFVEK